MDRWLEPKTRIPFIGILAIVLVVAVVAVFTKSQLDRLFPESNVQVQEQRVVSGSASFYGVREVKLERKELLSGVLSGKRTLRFIVDVPDALLTIKENEIEEEIEMFRDGDALVATFEFMGHQTRVVITNGILTYSEPGVSVISDVVPLRETAEYRATVSLGGNAMEVLVDRETLYIGADAIPLSFDGNYYRGQWGKHPVTLNPKTQILTVEDFY
jgi:hypothetical protein